MHALQHFTASLYQLLVFRKHFLKIIIYPVVANLHKQMGQKINFLSAGATAFIYMQQLVKNWAKLIFPATRTAHPSFWLTIIDKMNLLYT